MSSRFLIFITALLITLSSCQQKAVMTEQVTPQKSSKSFSFGRLFRSQSQSLLQELSSQEKENLSKNYPSSFQTLGKKQPLQVSDIVALSHVINEEKLLAFVQRSKGNYPLDAATLISLKEQGVSNLVLHEMLKMSGK